MCFLYLLVVILLPVSESKEVNKLLVIFIDGLRWDYFDQSSFYDPDLNNSASIKKVIPVFPADCHPNIYSAFTGVYPSSHGIISNQMYNSQSKTEFHTMNKSHHAQLHKWLLHPPLWSTLKQKNLKTILYDLPVCDSSEHVFSPSQCFKYSHTKMTELGLNESLADAIAHLKRTATFAVVYNDMVDTKTHECGPDSEDVKEHLTRLAKIIKHALHSVKYAPINVVLMSDHGMAQMAPARTVNLERLLIRGDIEHLINMGSTAAIWPKPGKLYDVISRIEPLLKGANIYTEEKPMPSHLQTQVEHRLMAPIFIVAHSGYFIETRGMKNDKVPHGRSKNSNINYKTLERGLGWHGYSSDDTDMHTSLFLWGPDVKPGATMDSAHIVDIYPLFWSLLTGNSDTAMPINGSFEKIHHLINNGPSLPIQLSSSCSNIFAFTCFVLLTLIFSYMVKSM